MTRDMRRLDMNELADVVSEEPYSLVFATVSGAHLYGFPSRDSDVDIRGAHLLGLSDVVGLHPGPDTLDKSWLRDGADIDLVTHDVAKFCRLLLNRNGYVLEQLLSHGWSPLQRRMRSSCHWPRVVLLATTPTITGDSRIPSGDCSPRPVI